VRPCEPANALQSAGAVPALAGTSVTSRAYAVTAIFKLSVFGDGAVQRALVEAAAFATGAVSRARAITSLSRAIVHRDNWDYNIPECGLRPTLTVSFSDRPPD
jgi:hypothetical protein